MSDKLAKLGLGPRDARILDISPEDYFRHPGFSQSIASTLIERSPLHAWHEHPAFGGKEKASTPAMDFGSVAHALVLGKGKRFAPVPFDSYRTAAAKETRENYRKAGVVPLLTHELTQAEECAAAVTKGLVERGFILDGQSEAAIEWTEMSHRGPLLCKSMLDHVWFDRGVILDLKFVENASQANVERSAERMHYAIQWAAYTSALCALRPEHLGRTTFIFAFCETESPYAINLCRPDGSFREIGEKRWRRAVNTWAFCLDTEDWPGYDGEGINLLTSPAWAVAKEGL